MKNLLLSSIVLLMFSCSILIFQISCQKDALANPISEKKKIVYYRAGDIWISDIDGSNNKKVPITFTSDNYMLTNDCGLSITSDNVIVFCVYDMDESTTNLYTCNIDGSNLKEITSDGGFGDAYNLDAN